MDDDNLGVVSPSLGRIPLSLSPLLYLPFSSLSLSISLYPQNLSSPCFLIYWQPSGRLDDNIGERDVFAVVTVEENKNSQ